MIARTDILPEDLTEEQEIVVEAVLTRFKDGLPRDSGQFVPRGERVRQPKPAKDIDELPDLIKAILDDKQQDVDEKYRVLFLEDFPPGEMTTEIITFGLAGRWPASLSRGSYPNRSGVKELKPHIRGMDLDPTQPNNRIVTMGQQFDNEMVFTCWAKTNKQANFRARWLEDTLKEYTWYIRYNGIHQFLFLEQEEDVVIKLDGTNQVLRGRPLKFYVRTERLTHVLEPVIRRIVVRYGLEQSSTN